MRIFFLLGIAVLLLADTLTCRTQMLMGTYAKICAPDTKQQLIQQAFERLKSVETALSSYDHQADIYKLNHQGAVNLKSDTYEALLKSRRYYYESGTLFNIAIGAITKKLYRFGENERIPTPKELDDANITFLGLHFGRDHARLEKNIQIDLGGMGKGFGVDKAAEIFRQSPIQNATIALSGDIRCLGHCDVAVTDPFHEGRIIERFHTRKNDLGISTSGNYQRYVKSQNNNHLIDPDTKRPAHTFASITLIGPIASSDLDAYATAASLMDIHEAKKFLAQFQLAYILYTLKGTRIASSNLTTYANINK